MTSTPRQVDINGFGGYIGWFTDDGKLHREDGPAVKFAGGGEQWYINGRLHRKDGPALTTDSGITRWALHGDYIIKPDDYIKSLIAEKMIEMITHEHQVFCETGRHVDLDVYGRLTDLCIECYRLGISMALAAWGVE